jgi:NADPH-dependent glutamate synthase beta subunit-like oxidoreductase
VLTGTGFLNRVNSGEKVEVGERVVVVGGGDTAIDAARVARRLGAAVTIVYRRTRTEMPAIASEIDQAIEEGVDIVFLAAPVAVKRTGGALAGVVVQRMELGEPDASGRRRPVPVAGSEAEIAATTLVAAISQEPEIEPVAALGAADGWFAADALGAVAPGVWAGGDDLELGLATISVFQGRRAAEAIDAALRGVPAQPREDRAGAVATRVRLDVYDAKPRAERSLIPAAERLARGDDEIDRGITREQFLEEATRCLSCGLCWGCEKCWMYCQAGCFAKLEDKRPGHYFKIKLELCDGCKKCADECPCGFLEMT